MAIKLLFLSIILLLIFYAGPAYAYLDPASGSMLIYAIFGVLVTVVYSLRGAMYKAKQFIMGGSVKSVGRIDNTDIIFFSEGGKYWNVFAPIIEALDKKGIKCAYVTPDVSDDGLKYKSSNVTIKGFDSEMKAITFMNHLNANIVVSTTTQLDVYMLKRSKNVKHYIHVVHAPIDAAMYEKHAFDYYDSVFCSGPHQIKSIRVLEQKRSSMKKQLYEIGCTYYDVMLKQVTNESSSPKNKLTVLYAPSWGQKSSLVKYGLNLINHMKSEDINLIIRPHPQLFVSQKKLMNELSTYLNKYENVTLDRNPSGHASMSASNIMISDFSGIIFDYAFLFCKPIIVIDSAVETGGFEAEDLEEVWELAIRPKISRIVQDQDIQHLAAIISEETRNSSQSQSIISEVKKQYVYNFGKAGEKAANQIIELNGSLQNT